jgi:hypothetical protein
MKIGACLASCIAMVALGSATLPTADAAIIHYGTDLGPEVMGATGTGSVLVDYDTVEHTVLINASWSGLSGITTVAHIHCCVAAPGTVGVAVTPGTLPGFPVGVSAGDYTSPLIDLDVAGSFTDSFVTDFGGGTIPGAIAAFVAGLGAGTAYFNIHSDTFRSGEIRGFLLTVPEPATLLLLLPAVAGVVVMRRRKS